MHRAEREERAVLAVVARGLRRGRRGWRLLLQHLRTEAHEEVEAVLAPLAHKGEEEVGRRAARRVVILHHVELLAHVLCRVLLPERAVPLVEAEEREDDGAEQRLELRPQRRVRALVLDGVLNVVERQREQPVVALARRHVAAEQRRERLRLRVGEVELVGVRNVGLRGRADGEVFGDVRSRD